MSDVERFLEFIGDNTNSPFDMEVQFFRLDHGDNGLESSSKEEDKIDFESTYSNLGVKLSFFLSFFEKFLTEEEMSRMTTSDVCKKVKRLTQERRCSFCEYQESIDSSVVGKAEVFISHAWKYSFSDVIAVLKNHFTKEPDIILWFDILSNNQHIKNSKNNLRWWVTAFKGAIEEIGRTVMIIDDWNRPLPLNRGWCIWELYSTVSAGKTFEVAMSAENEQRFIDKFNSDPSDIISNQLLTVDCKRSRCLYLDDQYVIHEAIQSSIGFNKLNKTIIETLENWVIKKCESYFDELQCSLEPDHFRVAKFQYNLGRVHGSFKRFEIAEVLMKTSIDQLKLLKGEKHQETLTAIVNLGILYQEQGNYQSAELIFVECLDKYQEFVGKNPLEVHSLMNRLASLYYVTGRYGESETMYKNALDFTRITYGDDHSENWISWFHLGRFYQLCHDLVKAQELYEKCLKHRPTITDINDSTTLLFYDYLAQLYFEQQLPKPEFYLEESVKQLRTLFKFDDYSVIRVYTANDVVQFSVQIRRLGALYVKQAQYSKAQLLYENYLNQLEEGIIGGPDHPLSLKIMQDLGTVMTQLGEMEKAHELMTVCLMKRKFVLGEHHVDTLDSRMQLTRFYRAHDYYHEKIESFSVECLEIIRKDFPQNHLNFLEISLPLAKLYSTSGKYDPSEELYLESLERIKLLGKDNNEPMNGRVVLEIENCLALLNQMRNHLEIAETALKEGLEKSCRIFGKDDSLTLKYQLNLAELHEKQGKYRSAKILLRRLITDQIRTLGLLHPIIQSAIKLLILLYVNLGNCEEPLLLMSLNQVADAAVAESILATVLTDEDIERTPDESENILWLHPMFQHLVMQQLEQTEGE